MPRRAAERPAAYARTRHLERFLDQVSDAVPARVDTEYAEKRLGLRGGDVRAFLQTVRVLGLTDPWGRPTERLREAHVRDRQPAVLRAGLRAAYPELVERWERLGGLTRQAVEDHFKLEYGLGATSAGPAAKLFLDLWRRGGETSRGTASVREAATKGGEVGSGAAVMDAQDDAAAGRGEDWGAEEKGEFLSVRHGGDEPVGPLADLVRVEIERGMVRLEIGRAWDADRINLVFDRVERLIGRLQE